MEIHDGREAFEGNSRHMMTWVGGLCMQLLRGHLATAKSRPACTSCVQLLQGREAMANAHPPAPMHAGTTPRACTTLRTPQSKTLTTNTINTINAHPTCTPCMQVLLRGRVLC